MQYLSHPLGQLVPPYGTVCPTPWDKLPVCNEIKTTNQ